MGGNQKLNNKKRKRKIKVEGALVKMGGMWKVVNNRGNYDDYEDVFPLADWVKQYKEKKQKIQYKLSKSEDEEDREDQEENIQRSRPVKTKRFSDSKVVGEIPQNEAESDEEVLGDADYYDCDINGFLNFVVKKRHETDWGGKFVVRRGRWMTVTNPEVPEKFYLSKKVLKSKWRGRSFVTSSVLHDPDYPVAAVSKLALKTYNTIQNTEYEYVGLVKAYEQPAKGFHFTTRFKARLCGQDPIDFQAKTFKGFQEKETNVIPVKVYSVYPLPPS